MENSNENLLQSTFTDRLWPNMNTLYERTDSKPDTVITIKNDGPGEIKCNLFNMGNEKPWTDKALRAGDSVQFEVRYYDNGDTLKVVTGGLESTITIDNVKKRY